MLPLLQYQSITQTSQHLLFCHAKTIEVGTLTQQLPHATLLDYGQISRRSLRAFLCTQYCFHLSRKECDSRYPVISHCRVYFGNDGIHGSKAIWQSSSCLQKITTSSPCTYS